MHIYFKNIYFAIHSGFIPRKGVCCCAWWSPLPPWRADSGWASHTLQLSRAAAQYLTSALPWVVRSPHWDRLCPQVVEAPKMQFVPDAFQSGREAQRAFSSACACDPCHQHRWRFILLYELRALGLGKGATTEAFLGLTSENLGNLRTSLVHAMAPKEARCDQLMEVIPKLIVLCWEVQALQTQTRGDWGSTTGLWDLRLDLVPVNDSTAVLVLLQPEKKMVIKLRQRGASYSGSRRWVGWKRVH